MASIEKAIRLAVKAQLIAAPGITQTVEASRRYNPGQLELPIIFVRMDTDRLEDLYSDSPRIENRIGELEIVLHDHNTDDEALEAALDDGAEAIRVAVFADERFGDLAVETFYMGSEKEENKEGDRPIGAIALQFEVNYQKGTFEANVPADNLDKLDGGIDTPPVDEVIDYEIDTNFPA